MINEGQLSLWDDGARKMTAASACLGRLAESYFATMASHGGGGPLPREADEISLTCLALCTDYAHLLSADDGDVLERCRQFTADHSAQPWLDCFIWRLANEALESDDPMMGDYRSQLISDLDVGMSSIRCFILEIAWIVRRRLTVAEAAERLLKNVADTIAGWDIALGLCASLFDSYDEFWEYADAFSPVAKFDPQYRQRLAEVRLKGLANCLVALLDLELRCSRRISDIALSVAVDAS